MYNNNYNPYYHPVPPANPEKGVGFGAFVLFAVSTALVGLMYLTSRVIIPCVVPGGGEPYGWYDCNNSDGNGFMFMFALVFAAYIYLVLPTAGILAIVGAAKNSGQKWAIRTLIAIGIGITVVPFVYLFLSGTIKF